MHEVGGEVSERLFAGGGAVGAQMRSLDWSHTPLGAVADWSASLKTTLGILLNACNPMLLTWGNDRILFYNDAYLLLQVHQPSLPLGQPVQPGWIENWNSIEADVNQVFATGQPVQRENQRWYSNPVGARQRDRSDRLAARYFTWTYSAIWDETAQIAGVLAAGCEEVGAVLAAPTSQPEQQVAETTYERETRLQLALSAAKMGTWEVDLHTGAMQFDQTLQHLFGLSAETTPPNRNEWYQCLHPDDRDRVKRLFQQAVAGEAEYDVEYRIVESDGSLRWLISRGAIIQDELGQPIRAIGVAAEITDRKQSAEALRQSEERFQAFMDHSPAAAWMTDRDGRILYLSQTYFRTFHLSTQNVIGKSVFELYPADVAQQFLDNIQQAADDRQVIETVEVAPRSDGTLGEFLVYKFPVTNQAGATLVGGVAVDITDRIRAEAALRESEELKQRILESSTDCIKVLNLNSEVLYINTGGLRLLEIEDPTFVLNTVWIDFWQGEDQERARAALAAAKAGNVSQFQGSCSTRRGTPKWWDIVVTPLRDASGQVVQLAVVSRDMTQQKQAEDELRESEERFRNMADNAPVMVWVTDPTGYCTYLSQSWYEFTGQTEETGLGWGWFNAIHPEDREIAESTFRAANNRREALRLEYRLRCKDGAYHWAIDAASPRFGVEGEFRGYIGSVMDISDRKQAESALQQAYAESALQASQLEAVNQNLERTLQDLHIQEEELRIQNEALIMARQLAETERHRYQDLFNFAPDGYVVTDANGLIQEANQAITALLAYDSIAQTPTPLSVYVAESDRRAFRGFLLELHKYHSSQNCELNLKPFRGSPFPAGITAAAIRDGRGRVLSIRWLIRDITQRKQAEAALAANEARLQGFVDANVVGILYGDIYGNIHQANDELLRIVGYTREDLIAGRLRWIDITPPEYLPLDKQAIAEARANGACTPYEKEFTRKDGSRIPIFIGYSLVGKTREESVAFILDLSDRKRVEAEREQLLAREQAAREAAEAANRIKDEFLAVLSHELRSPLNPILGWVKLLQQGKFDATRTRNALATIERNAKLQVQLIDDLLDISRILQGKLTLNALPVHLSFVISAAVETVRLVIDAKAIQLDLALDPEVGQVLGDATRLQQVVWNLLSNAAKFTPAGGQITVVLTQVETHAQLQVKDTGKGIRADFLPYIFEHFRQEDGATTRRFGGLGLGLAIARQIVELHGGKIWAESPGEDQGATFTIELPLLGGGETRAQESGEADSSISSSLDRPLSGLRVLVVDDDPDSRDFVTFVVEQAGAEVTAAASAIEALQTLETTTFDLLLSDIGMPELDGYALIRQIRTMPPEQKSTIPAIALTAYAGEINQQQALQAGFQQHVAKPIEPNELIKTIMKVQASLE